MDLVEQAVACALSPQADATLQKQATNYCEQIKASPDGWQMCLALFVKDAKSAPEVRLFALQVVEQALHNSSTMLNASQLDYIRETLMRFVTREYVTDPSSSTNHPKEPIFLRNKLAHTITLLFVNTYPHAWGSFFEDFIGILRIGSPGGTNERTVDLFLRIMMAIDEEVVNLLVPRDKQSTARNTNIKDAMREKDIVTLTKTWYTLLGEYYDRDIKIATLTLRVVAAYVPWIDISLVVNGPFMSLLYRCLDYDSNESASRELQIAACECFTEIVAKGMKSSDKLELLRLLEPTSILRRLGAGSNTKQGMATADARGTWLLSNSRSENGDEDDEDEEELELTERAAKFTNAVGVELCRIHENTYPPNLPANSGSNESPELIRNAAYAAVEPLLPFLLYYLGNEYDDTSSCVFPFVGDMLNLLRRVGKPTPPSPASTPTTPVANNQITSAPLLSPSQRDFLLQILQAIVLKMKHTSESDPFPSSFPSHFPFKNSSQTFSPTHAPNPGAVGAGTMIAGDDSSYALFMEVRRQLKVFHDSIASIDRDLWLSFIHGAVCNVLEAWARESASGGNGSGGLNWMDVELALHLVFLLGEAEKGPVAFVTPEPQQQQLTPFGDILAKMVQSNVSAYPHASVQLVFFENVVRYWQFFEVRADCIGEVLHAFVDNRGLHHVSPTVRSRVYYLFHRFVKNLRPKIQPYASTVLNAIEDLLTVQAELNMNSGDAASISAIVTSSGANGLSRAGDAIAYAGIFDSQVYLFEAVGMLISLESWKFFGAPNKIEGCVADEGAQAKEVEMLEFVLNPIVTSIQAYLGKAKTGILSANSSGSSLNLAGMDPMVILQLHHLVMVIGSVSKGFPEVPKGVTSNAPYSVVFKQATEVIVLVLESLSGLELIRDASRFSFARLSNTLGSGILPYIPRLITSLLSDCHAAELVDFLPFTGLLIHRFSPDIATIVNGLLIPLIERVFVFLNTRPGGTDESVLLTDLKKAYLNFLAGIFNAEIERVFVSDENKSYLDTILRSVLHYATDLSDIACTKLAFNIVTKMVAAWGGAPEPNQTKDQKSDSKKSPTSLAKIVPSTSSSHTSNSTSINDEKNARREPLLGFDRFVYDSILPACLEAPHKPDFNVADGQAQLVLGEIALLQKCIYSASFVRSTLAEYLSAVYFSTLRCPPEVAQEYMQALQVLDVKQFKKYYIQFIKKCRS